MTLENLKIGNIVTIKNGNECFVAINPIDPMSNEKVLLDCNENRWYNFSDIDNKTLEHNNNPKMSIVKVEETKDDSGERVTIWKKDLPKVMTIEEIEEALGHGVRIVG